MKQNSKFYFLFPLDFSDDFESVSVLFGLDKRNNKQKGSEPKECKNKILSRYKNRYCIRFSYFLFFYFPCKTNRFEYGQRFLNYSDTNWSTVSNLHL